MIILIGCIPLAGVVIKTIILKPNRKDENGDSAFEKTLKKHKSFFRSAFWIFKVSACVFIGFKAISYFMQSKSLNNHGLHQSYLNNNSNRVSGGPDPSLQPGAVADPHEYMPSCSLSLSHQPYPSFQDDSNAEEVLNRFLPPIAPISLEQNPSTSLNVVNNSTVEVNNNNQDSMPYATPFHASSFQLGNTGASQLSFSLNHPPSSLLSISFSNAISNPASLQPVRSSSTSVLPTNISHISPSTHAVSGFSLQSNVSSPPSIFGSIPSRKEPLTLPPITYISNNNNSNNNGGNTKSLSFDERGSIIRYQPRSTTNEGFIAISNSSDHNKDLEQQKLLDEQMQKQQQQQQRHHQIYRLQQMFLRQKKQTQEPPAQGYGAMTNPLVKHRLLVENSPHDGSLNNFTTNGNLNNDIAMNHAANNGGNISRFSFSSNVSPNVNNTPSNLYPSNNSSPFVSLQSHTSYPPAYPAPSPAPNASLNSQYRSSCPQSSFPLSFSSFSKPPLPLSGPSEVIAGQLPKGVTIAALCKHRSRDWYKEELEMAEAQNDPIAMVKLARMHLYGQGCDRDFQIAQDWARRARSLGVACSVSELMTQEDYEVYKQRLYEIMHRKRRGKAGGEANSENGSQTDSETESESQSGSENQNEGNKGMKGRRSTSSGSSRSSSSQPKLAVINK
uniref:Uncharacterized protein n=1 Tax=Polytomella parva TaxID=51329 RepID=A0A7S0UWK9_9CHLO|mmetsp:Transcript_16692/g.30225  ORF Transcript_16692/g.30225 Transcript_16692/m.30225 type:complete len:671 (+) Transcript_16692:160-2172(+)